MRDRIFHCFDGWKSNPAQIPAQVLWPKWDGQEGFQQAPPPRVAERSGGCIAPDVCEEEEWLETVLGGGVFVRDTTSSAGAMKRPSKSDQSCGSSAWHSRFGDRSPM